MFLFLVEAEQFPSIAMTEMLSSDSREAPEAEAGPQSRKKLFCIDPQIGHFGEMLGKHCIKRLPMLYYGRRRRNDQGCP